MDPTDFMYGRPRSTSMESAHRDARPKTIHAGDEPAVEVPPHSAQNETAADKRPPPISFGPDDSGTGEPTASQRAYCRSLKIPERMDELGSLVDRTQAPRCKLALWAALHRERAILNAQRAWQATTDPHRRQIIEETLRSTRAEVDNEVFYLHNRAGGLTEADVTALQERKELELRVELQHGVNLTNHPGVRADGSQIVWTKEELLQIARGLGLLPRHTVADNPMLSRIERWNGSERFPNSVAGYFPEERLVVFHDRHQQPDDSLSNSQHPDQSPSARTAHAEPDLAEDVTHEIGHTVQYSPGGNESYQEVERYRQYVHISGWQKDVHDDQLVNKAMIHPAQVEALRDGGTMRPVGADGLIYQADRYNPGQVIARTNSTLPDSSHWANAAFGPEEQWAEHVSMAVMMPAQLATDMLDIPAGRVAQALRRHATAKRELLSSSKAKVSRNVERARQQELEAAEAAVISAKYVQRLRRKQFDLVRAALRADAATEAAVEELKRRGGAPTVIADFRAQAARRSTPRQIEDLASTMLVAIGK